MERVETKQEREMWLYEWVACRHALPIDAGQGSFSVNAAITAVAAWSDVEGKEKDTARQLLQPGSRQEWDLRKPYLNFPNKKS